MSKNRKRRDASTGADLPAAAGQKTKESAPDRGPATAPSSFLRGVGWQLLALVALSCVLGFTFNAASPVGVQFGELATTAPAVATVASATTNLAPISPPPVAVTVPAPAPAPLTTAVAAAAPHRAPLIAPPAPPVHSHTQNPIVTTATPLPGPGNPTQIHWPEAKALAAEGRAVLVDVRHKFSFDAGHIPGAVSLPETSPPAEFSAFLSQQPTNQIVIVYCSSTSCSQSLRVANRLVTEFHWPAVRYMTGGYLEYQQAELTKPAAAPAP